MSVVYYRKATEAEHASCIDFANMVFSMAHRPHDFKALLPKAYGDGRSTAAVHHLAVTEDGSIRGMVAVMPNELKIGNTMLKTGFVGTVSVHPYARGEGHMKKLMEMAIDAMVTDGADLALLGGQRQRYEYFGFTQGGVKRTHLITRTNLRHILGNQTGPALSLRQAHPTDARSFVPLCARLNDERPVAAHRSPQDFALIAQSWNSNLYIMEARHDFLGYVIASGESVGELMLTDWALTPWVIRCLMEKESLEQIELVTGEAELNLNRQLALLEEQMTLSHYDMIRIFNFPKVIGALMALKATYTPLADGRRSFLIDGQPMTITVCDGVPAITAEADDSAVALTAMEAQMLFFNLSGSLMSPSLPAGWAPLPLFMSPADGF